MKALARRGRLRVPLDEIGQQRVLHSVDLKWWKRWAGFPWKLPVRQARVPSTEELRRPGFLTAARRALPPGACQGPRHRDYLSPCGRDVRSR